MYINGIQTSHIDNVSKKCTIFGVEERNYIQQIFVFVLVNDDKF